MNTNIITTKILKTKRFVTALLLLFTLSLNFSCIDNAEEFQVVTANPFGVAIIVFSSIPNQMFGNGTDIDIIKINTGLIPNGSIITAKITRTFNPDNPEFSDIRSGGCVIDQGTTTVQDGMARFNFLSPIFIRNSGGTEIANLAVSIVILGTDTPDTTINDFVSLLIGAVGIVPPPDKRVQAPTADNPVATFIDLPFQTTGFAPGTLFECMVSDPDLGLIQTQEGALASTADVPVLGTKENGRLLVKYFPNPGAEGGNQIVTCMTTIQNPITVDDVDDNCESVPEEDRKASAEVLVVQGPADLPTPNDVTCAPNPITGGQDGFCTCNGTNAAGLEICISSSPGGDVIIDEDGDGDGCRTADVNGTVVIPFATKVVDEEVIEQVICEITEDSGFFAQTNVTVIPGVVESLVCVPNPVASDIFDGDPTAILCTCSTNSPDTQVCFEEVIAAPELDFTSPTCLDSDAIGNAILIPTVDAGVAVNTDVLLECCLDSEITGNCNGKLTAEFTVNITPFVPPVTSISCTAQSTTLGPDQDTVINISTSGLVFGIGEVCVDILVNSGGSNGESSIGVPGGVCSLIDANDNANIVFNGAETVVVEQEVTVRCFIDNGSTNDVFDPGELADLEFITLDPAAGPAPVEVACSPFPVSVLPGSNSLLTATLLNAGTGTAVCFEFFTNTAPDSELSDSNEPANTTRVCSTTNLSNQAFATFTADADITLTQNANIICCADTGAGAADDCEPDDPQTITAVEVVAVPPAVFQISISSATDTSPDAGQNRLINAITTPAVPENTNLCIFMSIDNITNGDTAIDDDGSATSTVGVEVCEETSVGAAAGSGAILNDFDITIDVDAEDGEFVTVVGCIDLNGNDDCDVGEPLSNNLTFIVVIP